MYKKLITIILLITLVGCSVTEKEPQTTKILDSQDNVIYEIKEGSEFPKKYEYYLEEVFNEVGKVDDSKVSKIKTNMNAKIQEILYEQLNIEDQRIYYGAIVRDNKSGEVLAIHNPLVPPIGPIYSGSEIYEKEDKRISDIGLGINTLDITSPINIYALAFEHLSLSTADYTLDKSFKHPGTNMNIINKDGKYKGIISVKEAFIQQRMPVIRFVYEVIKQVPEDTILEYLKQIYGEEAKNLLVSSSHLKELSNGYQMIFDGGMLQEQTYYKSITIEDNEKQNKGKSNSLLSEQSAYLVSQFLNSFIEEHDAFSMLNTKRDYKLYGIYGENTNDNYFGSGEMYHFGNTMVIGNVDYSIVITGINQGSIETTNKEVSETMIAVIDEVFDELEKQNPNMTKEIEMPLGIIETNYLPGKVDKDGFDLHVPNTTKNKNIGYAKEK